MLSFDFEAVYSVVDLFFPDAEEDGDVLGGPVLVVVFLSECLVHFWCPRDCWGGHLIRLRLGCL